MPASEKSHSTLTRGEGEFVSLFLLRVVDSILKVSEGKLVESRSTTSSKNSLFHSKSQMKSKVFHLEDFETQSSS